MGAWYADTSALTKLVLDEPHSSALRSWTAAADVDLIASDLTRTELMRAARRRDPALAAQALDVLDAIDTVPVTPRVFRSAGALDAPGLRTLDALHLAVALDVADDLDGLVCYDDRLADAARIHGLRVVAPGS